ncbi:hypothetical protein G3M48_007927 [Beauveria asiatica]|uniref:Uncharacterized protein n=1 Tax=Beauveria asiatica TaxID=1069075 RepID=A0AAW0RL89_9HYPO
MAPIEGSLFIPFQTSIDNSYVSNVGSQQVHGTPSAASPSRSFMFRSPLPSCRIAARQKRLQARDNAVPFSRPQFDPVHDAASPYHSEGAASGQRTTVGPLSRQSHADLRLSPVAFDQFALENPTAETELFASRLSPRGSSYQAYPSSQAPGQPQPAGVVQNLPREVTSLSLVDPAPDASVQIIMPDASAHDQTLSYRAVHDLNALASAASQTCPLYHDGDSGYGGSAMSSQSSMATSAMPIPFGDREQPIQAVDPPLCGPERPNNVPARPIGGHRTALPDEAPLLAAATGSNSTTRHLPVLDSTPDKAAADNPPVGTNRRPHTAGQKRSAESGDSDHRLSRKRHNPPTMDAEHEHNTDLHSPVPESTHLNNSIWEFGASSEHQTGRTLAIEGTPGLGVFASSRTAYNDNRDNGESNTSNDFSALVSVDSFATAPNAPVEVDHTHSTGAPNSTAGEPNISFRHNGQRSSLNLDLTGSQSAKAVHFANTQGSPPAGKDGTTIASGLDSQTWIFDLSDQALEDSQAWNFGLDDQALEDSQAWNFGLDDQAFEDS